MSAPTGPSYIGRTTLTAALAALVLLAFPALSHAKNSRVTAIDHSESERQTTVRIRTTATPAFTVYKLTRPDRVVVDIAGASIASTLTKGENKASLNVNTWSVGQVTAQPAGSGARKVVRVVVTLSRASTYKVKAVGDDVLVRVRARKAKPAAAMSAVELTRATARAKQAEGESRLAKARAAQAQSEVARERARRVAAERAASAAKKNLTVEQKRTKELAARAARDAEAARRSIAAAKSTAAKARADASKQIRTAETKLAEANRALSSANELAAVAERARERAARSARAATDKERKARAAEERARQKLASAERSKNLAARYKREAERAEKTNASDAEALRKKAVAAATAAQDRQRAAEREALSAEKRRTSAERAAKLALQRTRSAEKQYKLADARRDQALAETRAAESARAAAQTRQSESDRRASVSKKRLAELERAAKAAESRAETARQSRLRELAAIERARKASVTAATQRQAAAKSDARAKNLRATIARLESDLAKERQQLAAARAQRAKATSSKRAREARRANEKRIATLEKQIASQNGKLSKAEAKRRDLTRSVNKASAKLAALEKKAARAKNQRRAEERELASINNKRRAAEQKLASANSALARARAEAVAAESRAAKARTRAARAETRAAAQKSKWASDARARVREVDYVDRPRSARVVLGLSAPAKPRVLKSGGKRAVLEFQGSDIARSLEKTLDTSRFGGPVRAVSTFRDRRKPGTIRVVVDLTHPVKGKLSRTGNTYYWDFAKPAKTVARTKRAPAKQPRRNSSATAYAPRSVAGYGSNASAPITQQTVAQLRRSRRTYRGRKVDLDYKNADMANLLRLLATVGGVNMVVPDDIGKKAVTVRLKNVPWDQAMEVILASKGLWYRREGNLIRVAKREELQKEDELEAKRIAALVQSEPPEPEIFTLNYASAADVKKQLGGLASPKGRIEVISRTNSLLISDISAHRRKIIALARSLDTQTPQIQIEARIVEARRTFVREFGIQWGGNGSATTQGGNATGLVFPSNVSVAGAADDGGQPVNGLAQLPPNFAVNMPAAIGLGSGGGLGISLGSIGGNFNLALRLSALEDQGTIRIVSQPKITTSNNVGASIKSGTSIPISVVSASGVQTQFVNADLSLNVTPAVSQRDCSVRMNVLVKKNEADFANTGARGDPSILTKEAKTTVVVADGATTVIGGIYTRNTGVSTSKVPFFADIPVLGYLFRNHRENDERTEVLVFLTPKITNRAFLRCER